MKVFPLRETNTPNPQAHRSSRKECASISHFTPQIGEPAVRYREPPPSLRERVSLGSAARSCVNISNILT